MDLITRYKKTIAAITMAAFLATGMPAFAAVDADWGNDPADGLSTEVPARPSDPGSYVYSMDMEGNLQQITPNENAGELTSLIDPEVEENFIRGMDRLLQLEVIGARDLLSLTETTDAFRMAGGTGNGRDTASLLQSAETANLANTLGLEDFQLGTDSCVQVLQLSNGLQAVGTPQQADQYIYVVSEDATCFVVVNELGMGIPNALVTIRYEDDNGREVTRSARTIDGDVPGIVAFTDMPATCFATVDLQAEGYESKTILSHMITGGAVSTLGMATHRGEAYLRSADLDGADLLNRDNDFLLVQSGSEPLTWSILVTAPEGKAPATVDLYATNRNAKVATFTNPSKYSTEGGEQTLLFQLSKDWMGQNKGLLQEGDTLELRMGNRSVALSGIQVENAYCTPGMQLDVDLPLVPQGLDYSENNFNDAASAQANGWTDTLAGAGLFNGGLDVLGVKVSYGYYPDGAGIILASYSIKKYEDKMNSLFKQSWKPSMKNGLGDLLTPFKTAFWDSVDNINAGNVDAIGDKYAMLHNNYYQFSVTVNLMAFSRYNKATQMMEGDIAFVMAMSQKVGVTEYILVFAGPVTIPAYLGVEVGADLKGTLEGNAQWKDGDMANTIIRPNGAVDLRFDFIPALTGYVGLGLRGILSGEVNANVALDTALMFRPFSDTKSPFHAFIDFCASMKVLVDAFLFHFQWAFANTGWIRLVGSDHTDMVSAGNPGDVTYEGGTWERRDLSETDENATRVSLLSTYENQGNVTTRLAVFTLEDKLESTNDTLTATGDGAFLENGLERSWVEPIDYGTYADGQMQMVEGKLGTPVLFRIINDGERTRLIYQAEGNGQGRLDPEYRVVEMPDGADVTEYKVITNTVADHTYAYIGAICGDNSAATQRELLDSMFAAGVVVDLNTNEEITCKKMSGLTGAYLYQPMPACIASGDEAEASPGAISIGYKKTCAIVQNGTDADSLFLNENPLLNALSNYNDAYNVMVADNGASYLMGTGDFYCSGYAESSTAPVFWTAERVEKVWDEDILYIRARGFDGTYRPGDVSYSIKLNVTDYQKSNPEEPYIADWTCVNGVNYILACGKLQYLAKQSAGEYVTYSFVPVAGTNSLPNMNGAFSLVGDRWNNMVYVASVVKHYDVTDGNEETQVGEDKEVSAELQGATLTVSAVSAEPGSDDGMVVKMHEPLRYQLAIPADVDTYTYLYRAGGSSTDPRGMYVVYSHPSDFGPESGADIGCWYQNEQEGILLQKVTMDKTIVSKADAVIGATLTLQNVGTQKQESVRIEVHSLDEEGRMTRLSQVVPNERGWWDMLSTDYAYPVSLWTGDTVQQQIYFLTNRTWNVNQSYTLRFDVYDSDNHLLASFGEEDLQDSTWLLEIGKDASLTLEGSLGIVNNRHVAELTITNRSYYGAEPPKLAVAGVPHNQDGDSLQQDNTVVRTLTLGTSILDTAASDTGDNPVRAVRYNVTMDLEDTLKELAKQGMGSVKIYPVDENGTPLYHAVLELDNPYYVYEDKGKEDPGPEPGYDDYDYGGGSYGSIGSAGAVPKTLIMTIGSTIANAFGKVVYWDVAPFIVDSRTFTPVRFVAEEMGATVVWNPDTQQITITKGDTCIVLRIDSKTALVNGKPVAMDVAPFIVDNRTFTPSRYVAEFLGGTVAWNNDTRQVTVTVSDNR